MKTICILSLLIISLNVAFGCDCAKGRISSGFYYSEVVCILVVGENHQKGDTRLGQKLTFRLIENLKGTPYDTIYTGGMCGTRFHVGDTILLFGNNNHSRKMVETNMCSGSRVIGISKEFLVENPPYRRRNRNKNLIKLELETARFYKALNDNSSKNKRLKFQTGPYSIHEIRNKWGQDSEAFHRIRNELNVCHLKIKHSRKGNIRLVKILNKIPKKIKKELKIYLNNCKWRVYEEDKRKRFFMIESLLYGSEKITFWNF